MLTYTLRRLALAVPLLFGVAALNFALVSLAPGDAALALLADGSDRGQLEALRERFGLDRPVLERFGAYLGALARGNLGVSLIQGRPVAEAVLERLPATLLLAGAALLIAATLGVPLGLWLAAESLNRPGLERAAFLGVLSSAGLPPFLIGQILILVFALVLGGLPTNGMSSIRESYTGFGRVLDVARHLILPALTLGLQPLAALARVTRAQALEVLGQEYVLAARAKGLSARRLLWKHVARNALPAPLTLLALSSGHWLGGAVITETVFAWPGLGRLAVEASLTRDFALSIGVILVGAVGVILANLIADLAVAGLDPRVRYA